MTSTRELPEILTVPEVANYLRLAGETVRRLAQEGKIPSTKVGGQWRFQRELIDEWLDQRMWDNLKNDEKAEQAQ